VGDLRGRAARLIGWVVATALLVYFARQVDLAQMRGVVVNADWTWVAVALVANAAILVCWTGMWWTVAPNRERVSFPTMFQINAMASALMNTLPFLGGHAAAVVMLVKRGGMTRQGALSVMALDQLGEGLAKVAIFGFVAAAAPIPDWMRAGIATACVGVGGLLIVLLLAAHGHMRLRGEATPADRGIVARARAFVAEWAARLETLRSVRQSGVALLFGLGTKVAEGAGILAVQYALGTDLTVGATSLVLAAVILGSILPVTPGNVGTYEAGAYLAYRHLGIDPGQATVLAVAGHVCFWIPSVGIGYLIGTWRYGLRGMVQPDASVR
jgi:uncharacterized protein (TIRG00374 family)